MRIVRLANFVTDSSGGLRTALRHLGAGYLASGHDPILVIPGARRADTMTVQGRVITLPGVAVPGIGGYRLLLDRVRVRQLLHRLEPDRVEVSDRTTLRWVGRWARRHGVPSMMISHESLDGLLKMFAGRAPAAARRIADILNARTAADYDLVVCTTSWAAAEFTRLGTCNVQRIALGVDLDQFHPDRYDPGLRSRFARAGEVLLVHCGRLSVEKRPQRSLETVAALRAYGVPATLVVAGDGPLRQALRADAERRDLPVRFLGHLADRAAFAALLAVAHADGGAEASAAGQRTESGAPHPFCSGGRWVTWRAD